MMLANLKARKPETILVADDLYVLWKDGLESHYRFFDLRAQCPCALCVNELTGERILDPSTLPPNIRIRTCEYVGNYALRIFWSDGHNSGIYTFKQLRELSAPSPA